MGYEDAEVALKEGMIHSSTSGSNAVLVWEERRKHQEPTCQTLLSLLRGNFLIDTHTNSTPCDSLPQRMRSALKPTEPEHNKGCLLSSSFIDGTFSRFSHLLQEVDVLIYLLLLFSQEERLSGGPMTLRAKDFWMNTYTQHTAKRILELPEALCCGTTTRVGTRALGYDELQLGILHSFLALLPLLHSQLKPDGRGQRKDSTSESTLYQLLL